MHRSLTGFGLFDWEDNRPDRPTFSAPPSKQIWSGGQHQLLLGWAATDELAGEDGLDEDEGAYASRRHLSMVERLSLTNPNCPPDVYVKPGVAWDRGGREVCILGLDGAVAFFEVIPLEDYPLVEGIGTCVGIHKYMYGCCGRLTRSMINSLVDLSLRYNRPAGVGGHPPRRGPRGPGRWR